MTKEEPLVADTPRELDTYKPCNNLWQDLELRQWHSRDPEVSGKRDKSRVNAAIELQARREFTKAKIRNTPWVHSGMRGWYARSSSRSTSGSSEKSPNVAEDIIMDAAPASNLFKKHNPLWVHSALHGRNAGRFGAEDSNIESQKDFLERHQGFWDNLVPEYRNVSEPNPGAL